MQNLQRVPFAEVIDFSKFEPDATKLYNMKVDKWQSRFSGGEPYRILPGDIFVLADFKPESVCNLQRIGRSWGNVSVTKKASEKVNEDNGSSGFLGQYTHNRRIWKSLHVCRNLKIINEVLCTGSMDKKNYDLCSARNEDSPNEQLIESLCSELTESQTRAVWACIRSLHIANPSVELIQGPAEVAIMEVASILMKMVNGAKSNALFCPLGEILLFGNEKRWKVSPEIEEICLDYHVERFAKCLGPEETGWRHCFASMIGFLEGCVSLYHYHISSKNESTREKEQENTTSEIEEKESTSDDKVNKGKCKSFLQIFIEIFVSTASPLRDCIFVFCTHLSTSHILIQNFQNMSALISSLDSFESLLRNGNVISEELENLFSCQQQLADYLYIPEVAETMDYKSLQLCMRRSECLSVLKVPMVPPNILQLQGVKHAILVGVEYQLPAIFKSNVSYGAGFSRSLFERLSSLGHPKHILDMQYRMQPSISLFPNYKFYHNQIMDAPNVKRSCDEKRFLPATMYGRYSFINVIGGQAEKEGGEHNRKNIVEWQLL